MLCLILGVRILFAAADAQGQKVLLDKWVTAKFERELNRSKFYSAEEMVDLRTADGARYRLTLLYEGEYRPPGFGGEFIFYTVFMQLNGQDIDKLTSGHLGLPYLDGTVSTTIKFGEEDEFEVGAEVHNRRVERVRFIVRRLR